MADCLLCREINKSFKDGIQVNSTQWLELNIQNLIEKHLWPMETINPSAIICSICWQELYDFHKFYKRLEDVHMDIGATIMKVELEPEIQIDNLERKEDSKEYHSSEEVEDSDPLYKDNLIECKKEILMEQTMPLEIEINEKVAIKKEPKEDIVENEDVPLLQRSRKRKTCQKQLNKTKRKRTRTKELFSKNLSQKDSNDIDMDEITNKAENVDDSMKSKKSSYTFFDTNAEKDDFLAKNYKITCIVCDHPMDTFSALCKHFQLEHNEPGYVMCCNKKFSTRSILIDHVFSHLNPDHFKCNECGKIMSDRQSLDTHVKMIHKNNVDWREYCNICGEAFPDIHELKTHKLSHNLQDYPQYKLPETNQEKDDFLAKHYKISCILCEQPMETFDSLCKHFKMEHKQPGYVICCNKKFGNRSILVDHVHCHLNPDHFKCNHCDKVMSDRQCLEKHIRKRHVGNVEKNQTCDVCGKGFADRTGLRLHKAIHLPEEEKKFKCTECDKNFANEEGLAQHVRFIHLKSNLRVCDICGKTIRYANLFKRHMLEHEGKPLPTVSCDICGRRLSDKISLKRHKHRHHSGEKREHTCNICFKVVTSIYSLRKHIKLKHESGYDQQCTICEKSFNRPQALRDHLARHAGTALHSCPWCSKSFYSNGHMHAHRKKAHPKEWEEAQREKFSGNLPPNYKPPEIN